MLNFLRRVYGKVTATREPYFMRANPRYASIQVGEGTYGYPEVLYDDAGANLTIGHYCSIAPGVTILVGGEHHLDWVTTYPFSLLVDEAKSLPGYPFSRGDVVIGNDVWIGYGATILSGVKIGDGAVIAARSVVTRDIEPYSIVAGSPARHLHYRFSEEIIRSLTDIAWWTWPSSKIQKAWPLLQSGRVEEFIQKYGKRAGQTQEHQSGVTA